VGIWQQTTQRHGAQIIGRGAETRTGRADLNFVFGSALLHHFKANTKVRNFLYRSFETNEYQAANISSRKR
jgi:hypothetical protein